METVYTSCRICIAACGIAVTVSDENRVVRISPDKENPYSWRDFCPKGRTAHEAVEHPRRITQPMRRVGDRYVEATWEEALTEIASELSRIRREQSPDAIGLYWGNPAGMSASNAMFAAGLLDAIGTRSRYFPGSLDENNFHLVAEEMYGSPFIGTVPDVDDCRCFLLVGMNPAVSAMGWVENVPDGWRRALAAQSRGADIIVVDPRRTATAERADTHIAILPGGDWAFLLGLLKVILEEGWEHPGDCEELLDFELVRAIAASASLEDLSHRCEVPTEQIIDVAARFAHSPTAVCITHTGVAHQRTGTIAEWLGQLLNWTTGRMDRPGGRRYEQGIVDGPGLFAKMAKPLKGTSRVHGRRPVAGYHTVADLVDEITTPGEGQIRALIIDAGNPVVSGPDGRALDDALSGLELLVAIDLVQRESHRHAHWLLPGTHWLERSELNSLLSGFQDQPYVQYAHRAVLPPAGVREEWQVFVDLALKMNLPMFGQRGFNWFVRATRRAALLFRRPGLAFSPRWIDRALIASARRVKWKAIMAHPHGWIYKEREFGNLRAALLTKDKRVHAAPPSFVAELKRVLATPPDSPSIAFPFVLSNSRQRATMNSWLSELPNVQDAEQCRSSDLEIHPADAEHLRIVDGEDVRVTSDTGSVTLPARVTDATKRGVVVIAHGWGSRVFDFRGEGEPLSFGVNRNLLVSRRDLDPLAQIPALSGNRVSVERVATDPQRAAHRDLEETAVGAG